MFVIATTLAVLKGKGWLKAEAEKNMLDMVVTLLVSK